MAFKPSKRFLIHVGAAVAAGIIIAMSITQCQSEKKEMMKQVNKSKTDLNSAYHSIQNINHKVDSILAENRDLGVLNSIQADSLVILNDSVIVLNDSLTKVNARLEDCQKGKTTKLKRSAGNNNPKTGRRNQSGTVITGRSDSINISSVRSETGRPVAGKTDSVVIVLADSAHNEGTIISNGNTGNVRIEMGKGAVNKGQIFVNGTGNINYTVNQFNNASDSVRRDTIAQRAKWINQSATVNVLFVKQR